MDKNGQEDIARAFNFAFFCVWILTVSFRLVQLCVTIKYCLTPLIVVNKIEAWSCIGEETVLPKKLLEQNVHVGGESMSREWGEMAADFAGDPRKVFINYLIFLIKEIENRIYLYSKVSTAIVPLMGLIDSLDEKSKDKLKTQYEQLKKMKEGKMGLHNGAVEGLYRQVLTYLHGTYLAEVRWAKPRYTNKRKLEL